MSYYQTIECKTWYQFKELAEKSKLEWIFRGQSDSEWDLLTFAETNKIF